MIEYIEIFSISLILNILLAMMSRARNRNNITYHAILNFSSTAIWLMFMKKLMSSDNTILIISSIGSVIGGIFGQKISMYFEKKILAKSDDHIL